MKKVSTKLVFLIVLCMGIGFSYLTSGLIIRGNTAVSGNSWDIYFDNIQVLQGSVSSPSPTIDTNKTRVNFAIELVKPGDFYSFTVDAVNNGTIDAMIDSIIKSNYDEDISNLFEYTVTYLDGNEIEKNDILDAKSTTTYKILIQYKKDISASDLSSTDVDLNLSFEVNYVQKISDIDNATYGQIWEFDYTGEDESFEVPYNGIYKLEVWGASGGSASGSFIGGYGGYSVEYISLSKNDELHINVGQAGEKSGTTNTYNGGGSGSSTGGSSGGGATSIATSAGEIKNINPGDLLIIAGGGGGSVYYSTSDASGSGGSGGGTTGNNGTKVGSWAGRAAYGGTQSEGGMYGTGGKYSDKIRVGNVGSFGQGAPLYNCSNGDYCDINYQAGGGGGYYGGGGARHAGAGGGSGYLSELSIYKKKMYCYNCSEDNDTISTTSSTLNKNRCLSGYNTIPVSQCAKSGNGYAKITYISKDTTVTARFNTNVGNVTEKIRKVNLGERLGTLPTPTNTNPEFIFDGWYADKGYFTKVSSDYIMEEDTTIYAKWLGFEEEFNYIGTDEVYTIPASGIYQLEVWGASGGSANANVIGGYGGYSIGYVTLSKDDQLHINVGQAGVKGGTTNTYNGGGSGSSTGGSSGGGATSIATSAGEIKNINKNDLIIVAGGGGGSAYYTTSNASGNGGSGGGNTGVNGSIIGTWASRSGTGGTQESGGSYGIYNSTLQVGNSGAYGQGGSLYSCNVNDCNSNYQAGGGGGYYGGGGTRHSGAGGGSGYIGYTMLLGPKMYCYKCKEEFDNPSTFTVSTTGNSIYKDIDNCPNGYSSNAISKCARTGNGYAKITYLGKE